jgi:hypothetical protein
MDEEEEKFVFETEESTEISEPHPGTGSELQSTLRERPPYSKLLFPHRLPNEYPGNHAVRANRRGMRMSPLLFRFA